MHPLLLQKGLMEPISGRIVTSTSPSDKELAFGARVISSSDIGNLVSEIILFTPSSPLTVLDFVIWLFPYIAI